MILYVMLYQFELKSVVISEKLFRNLSSWVCVFQPQKFRNLETEKFRASKFLNFRMAKKI